VVENPDESTAEFPPMVLRGKLLSTINRLRYGVIPGRSRYLNLV
jgi:hypothetical protein